MKEIEYTVVIPHRNEGAELKKTIENIQETQENCAAIIAKEDKGRAGTAATRHAGTLEAKTDIVITVDGHMKFDPGSLDNLAAFLAEDETRVGCLSCCHNPKCEFTDSQYWGADLYEFGGEYALEPKWSKCTGPGEIACLMGACYGFSRPFYDRIGQPWKIGRGWGCDETLLSIPARLAGGSVHVLADRCAHLMKKGADVQYRQSQKEIEALWYTRCALVELVRPDNAEALFAHMNRKLAAVPSELKEAAAALDRVRSVGWGEYREKWLIPATAAAPTTTTATTTTGAKRRLRLPSVPETGVRCPHCGLVSDCHRVTTTYPNGNRRRVCASCERPFISRFVV